MRPNFDNVIAGFDPGLGTTGWGIIHSEGSSLTAIASGSICADAKLPIEQRLLFIKTKIDEVLNEYRPFCAGIEKAFAGVSIESAFLLGSARAACLIALAKANVEVLEFAPTAIKKAITGKGRADKQQMGFMVKTLLPTSQCQNDHEADAFAIALVASWQNKTLNKMLQVAV